MTNKQLNKIVKCPLIWGGGLHVNFTMKSIKRAIVQEEKEINPHRKVSEVYHYYNYRWLV